MRDGWRAGLGGVVGLLLVASFATPLTTSSRSARLNPATALASGTAFACALSTSGHVACWGDNREGQLGPGRPTPRDPQPRDVAGLAGPAVALAAGYAHACALLVSGEVECWGANANGQLGDGRRDPRSTPTPVSSLGPGSGVVALVASQNTTCAERSGSTSSPVWCWGQGEGRNGDALTPVPVAGVPRGSKLASPSCALSPSGQVWCWNSAEMGASPLRPPFSSGPAVFTSGVHQLASTGLALCALTGRRVSCVGENLEGQLGLGVVGGSRSSPARVLDLPPSRYVAGGYGDVCSISLHGALWCWGLNLNGQLGDGGTLVSPLPQPVLGLSSGVTSVAFGAASTCALAYSEVWCWGDNSNGQLGDGSVLSSLSPRLVALS